MKKQISKNRWREVSVRTFLQQAARVPQEGAALEAPRQFHLQTWRLSTVIAPGSPGGSLRWCVCFWRTPSLHVPGKREAPREGNASVLRQPSSAAAHCSHPHRTAARTATGLPAQPPLTAGVVPPHAGVLVAALVGLVPSQHICIPVPPAILFGHSRGADEGKHACRSVAGQSTACRGEVQWRFRRGAALLAGAVASHLAFPLTT